MTRKESPNDRAALPAHSCMPPVFVCTCAATLNARARDLTLSRRAQSFLPIHVKLNPGIAHTRLYIVCILVFSIFLRHAYGAFDTM